MRKGSIKRGISCLLSAAMILTLPGTDVFGANLAIDGTEIAEEGLAVDGTEITEEGLAVDETEITEENVTVDEPEMVEEGIVEPTGITIIKSPVIHPDNSVTFTMNGNTGS